MGPGARCHSATWWHPLTTDRGTRRLPCNPDAPGLLAPPGASLGWGTGTSRATTRGRIPTSRVSGNPSHRPRSRCTPTTVGDLTGACPNGRWVPSGTITGSSLAVYQGGVQVL
jgi:hypothetical protein